MESAPGDERILPLEEEIRAGFEECTAFDPLITNRFVERNWYEAFYGRHVQQLAEWTRDAEILHVFPDLWPAYLDFAGTGEMEGAWRVDSPLFSFFLRGSPRGTASAPAGGCPRCGTRPYSRTDRT